MRIKNPATLELLQEVSEDTPAEVAEKARRARKAQPAWAATPLEQRLEAIARFRDLSAERLPSLALTLTREMGKPIRQSENELSALKGRLDFFLEKTPEAIADEVVFSDLSFGLREVIGHEPLGVVANISAWNYPWFVGTNVFVPALLTGNAVLYKPSELATLTGLSMAELLHQSGIPEDVFIAVIGDRAVGAALTDQPIDGLFFTGSYATGRALAEKVAPRLIRIGLELGGKDPSYVCEDVDVKAAAESLADGAMYNTGQSCCAVERIYVNKAIAEPFLAAFVEAVRGLELGDPEDRETSIGPLARGAQIELLEAQVKDALSRGGRLLLGGKRAQRRGHYFEPTVIAGADNGMRLMREESFGPVIGIATVESDEQAVELMNDTAYGLTAGVYTRDEARARKILSRVQAGSAYWNVCDRVSPRLPWSGRKHSGIGSTLSVEGIRAFVQPKAWHLRG